MIKQMFCIPYAGGSSAIFNGWKTELGKELEICPIEYAGHGRRMAEGFYATVDQTAEDAALQIKEKLNGDYVIYGHSMGCVVAFEAICLMEKFGMPLPKALIIGACRPRHLNYKRKCYGDMDRDELMRAVADMGQLEDIVFEYPELYDIVADMLYADFQMLEKYKINSGVQKIPVPIYAMSGTTDWEAPTEDVKEWKLYTDQTFEFREFEGNHFFSFKDKPEVWEHIRKILNQVS